ncbi:uncharacterized protein LOC113305632 [Papaver somniferum]|uniref:uncharacterized protein LOC113305632 n=1 Tax=Papaver somniferum TaxID=3469 RepID=UPI000E6FB9DD|nr:uncharacterized protein LOC113305632 [Papaver somniferum]
MLRLIGMKCKIIHNSSDERKGNIWLCWSASISDPLVISTTKQAITVKVGEVMVTGIHGANLSLDRRELWQELESIRSYNLPLLVIGDFNVVFSIDENKSGRIPLRTSMLDFVHCLDSCGLINVPKSGLVFSWCNNRAGAKRILCNLDRALILKKWNWDVFGDVNAKLIQVEQDVLHATLASDNNPEDTKLLNNLVTARGVQNFLTSQQNAILLQKSRTKWLKEGAGNTRFFHTTMKIRQTQNYITELEDENENILATHREISEILVKHYA